MELLNRFQTRRALASADRLARAGQPAAAIARLNDANRRRPDAALERAAVDLLLRERCTAADSASTPIEPKAANNIVFTDGGIPEVDAGSFNAAVLRAAIDGAGYLIVRGFFNSQDAGELRDCIDSSLGARAESVNDESIPAESPWYYPSPHFPGTHVSFSSQQQKKQFGRTGSFMVMDSPRGSFLVRELYQKYGLKQLVQQYFGEPAVLATRKWVFRLVEPKDWGDSIGGGWHQDGRFMGEGIRALNMWVSLSDCGEGTDAPGIALLPKRITEILETGTRGAKIDWVVPPALVEELAQENPMVCPRFAPGDALFFDHLSLHRSGHGSGYSKNRYALESWFYAGSASADNAVIDLL